MYYVDNQHNYSLFFRCVGSEDTVYVDNQHNHSLFFRRVGSEDTVNVLPCRRL